MLRASMASRIDRALDRVKKLPAKKRKRFSGDIDDWERLKKKLEDARAPLDLDKVDRQIDEIERQIAKA